MRWRRARSTRSECTMAAVLGALQSRLTRAIITINRRLSSKQVRLRPWFDAIHGGMWSASCLGRYSSPHRALTSRSTRVGLHYFGVRSIVPGNSSSPLGKSKVDLFALECFTGGNQVLISVFFFFFALSSPPTVAVAVSDPIRLPFEGLLGEVPSITSSEGN